MKENILKGKKAALHNLGCKVNSYETDAMTQMLKENGCEIVEFKPGADIYIINTCTVTNIADRKSRQMLHKAKKMNENSVVVAVGCYVQAAKEELTKDNSIDILLGTNKKNMLIGALEDYFLSIEESIETKINMCEEFEKNNEYEEMQMTSVTEHTRAFIKIQDGCNQFCTYCIIPYSRGRIRSRKLENLISEVEELAKKGYKEIILTGIHLSSYGLDFKEESEEKTTLLTAIKEVAKIEGIQRIRLGSLEQGIISKDFLEEISKIEKFCPHFHLSLQSGCEATLRRMNRHYTPSEYIEKCKLIRSYYRDAAITTDVIVGFPGESAEEFEETFNFLKEVEFSEMHIFKYSKRKGTIAEKMENQVDSNLKNERSDKLIELGKQLQSKYKKKFVGKNIDILAEEKISIEGDEYFIGHTKEYVKVAVKSKEDLTNKIVNVKVTTLLNEEILLADMIKIY